MRLVLASLIAVLCLAAAAAIIVIVTGELTDEVVKVAWTTFAVPVFFPTAYVQVPLLTRGRVSAGLGWLGVLISVAGFLTVLVVTWGEDLDNEALSRVMFSLLVAAVALASLALLIRQRRPAEATPVTYVFYATGMATIVLAGILIYAIETESDDEALGRATAVAGVLWALGIVMLPLLRKLLPASDATRD